MRVTGESLALVLASLKSEGGGQTQIGLGCLNMDYLMPKYRYSQYLSYLTTVKLLQSELLD